MEAFKAYDDSRTSGILMPFRALPGDHDHQGTLGPESTEFLGSMEQGRGTEALGVVFGGSGNGEQIAANKVKGVRAALVWNEATAQLAREHNDANVVSIGARQHSKAEALHLIDIFIATPFSGDERHVRRIGQIAHYEQTQ